MDPTIKAQWCDALESGEYTKGVERLHIIVDRHYEYDSEGDVEVEVNHGKSFCCLGVLTDLWMKADPEHRRWMTKAEIRDFDAASVRDVNGVTIIDPGLAALPIPVQDWANVSANPNLAFDDRVDTEAKVLDAASLNDDFTLTFADIADFIRKDPTL
jgi:hypothetical protein